MTSRFKVIQQKLPVEFPIPEILFASPVHSVEEIRQKYDKKRGVAVAVLHAWVSGGGQGGEFFLLLF